MKQIKDTKIIVICPNCGVSLTGKKGNWCSECKVYWVFKNNCGYKLIKLKCRDCKLEFDINETTGKYTINKIEQLCCPSCQHEVCLG